MKAALLAVGAIMLLTLSGWAEQLPPREQGQASVASHRQEAQAHHGHRRHGWHGWHHRNHYRRHHGA